MATLFLHNATFSLPDSGPPPPPAGPDQFLCYRATSATPANTGTSGSAYDLVPNAVLGQPAPVLVAASGGVPAHLHCVPGHSLSTASVLPSAFAGTSSTTFFLVVGFPDGIGSTRNMAGYGDLTASFRMRDLVLFTGTAIEHFAGNEAYGPTAGATVAPAVYAFTFADLGGAGAQAFVYINEVAGPPYNIPYGVVDTHLSPWYLGSGTLDALDGALPMDLFAAEAFLGAMNPADVAAHCALLKAEFSLTY